MGSKTRLTTSVGKVHCHLHKKNLCPKKNKTKKHIYVVSVFSSFKWGKLLFFKGFSQFLIYLSLMSLLLVYFGLVLD